MLYSDSPVFNSVSDMGQATASDGAVASTRGYSVDGVGGGLYRFKLGDSTTVDGGFVLTGVGGRWHLIDQSIAHWDQFGCVGDNTADDTARIQAALDSNKPNKIGARTYRVNGNLVLTRTLGQTAPSIEGVDTRNSVISVDSAATGNLLALTSCDGFTLRNFSIIKRTSPTTPGTFTAMRFNDCQRFVIDNIGITGAASGVNFNQDVSGTFLWDVSQLRIRYCAVGFRAISASSSRGTIHIENITEQPYIISSSDSLNLTITDQSNHARIRPSIIDGCRGINLSLYAEDGGTATQPLLSVGASEECYDLNLMGRITGSTSDIKLLQLDKVNGGRSGLAFGNGGYGRSISTTANTKNFTFLSLPDLSQLPTVVPTFTPATLSDVPAINYGPDPFLEYGLPGTLARPLTTNLATVTLESGVKPPFADYSMKVAAAAGYFTVDPATDYLYITGVQPFLDTHEVRVVTSGVLPSPLAIDTTYYVVNTSGNYFKLSASGGGAPINITTSGTGQNMVGRWGGNCYARLQYHFSDFPHLYALRGKNIGIGFWMYIPSNHPVSPLGAGLDAVGPFVYVQTGAYATGFFNAKKQKGEWYWFALETLVAPTDNSLDMYIYIIGNSASYLADINSVAYFVGPVIWVGGYSNNSKMAQGLFSNHAAASNPYNRVGTGTPAGVVYAPIGTVWHRKDGGASTSTYVKESTNGGTAGWVAK